MKKILVAATIVIFFVTGSVFAGQNTGGDKKTVTSGLNPQPLPPGRHRYRRTHRHGHKPKHSYSKH